MIYIIIIVSIFFIGALVEKESKYFYALGIVTLFILILFRSLETSTYDGVAYQIYFKEIVPSLESFDYKFWAYSDRYHYGYGYALLNALAKSIYDNFFTFQVLYTVISFVLLWLVTNEVNKQYSSRCMFMFVYCCYMYFWYSTQLLRQYMAILMIWLAILYYSQCKNNSFYWVKFVFLVGVGYLFHDSALLAGIAFSIFLILQKINDKFKVYFITLFSIVFMIFGSGLIKYIIKLACFVLDEKYLMWLTDIRPSSGVNFIFRLVLLWILYLNKEKLENSNIYLNAACLAVLIGCINSSAAVRMLEYYAIGYYGGMAQFKNFWSGSNRKIVMPICYIVFVIVLYHTISHNLTNLMDYHFYEF